MNMDGFKLILRCSVFYVAKIFGLFRLALWLTENDYRILCYHGGSIDDEHLFWPGMFISSTVFEKQLKLIYKYQFNVLPLDLVVKKARLHKLPKKSLVLTFDDGLYSTKKILEPILKKANYPATLYITTYYVDHQRPIFNVAVSYLFFKTQLKSFDIIFFNGTQHTFTTKGSKSTSSINTINDYAKKLDENKQNQLLQNIGTLLNIDVSFLWEDRIFHNVNADELKAIHDNGVFDIQLHTHRHDLPVDETFVIYEIQENRKVISSIIEKQDATLVHFCYPSGLWDKKHLPQLTKLGIVSATTVESGLNNAETDPLKLKRILCTNNRPLIVFEAEITGFNALLVSLLARFQLRKV